MNFLDILSKYRIKFQREGRYCRAGWIQFDCPFCSGGHDPDKPYCGYNLSKNYVNCWRCGGHSVIDTLMTVTGESFRVIAPLVKDIEVDDTKVIKPRGKLILPKGIGPMLKAHKNYLRGRGYIPKHIARLWDVQGIGVSSRLAWRIFIPITYHGQVVSWTTRSISDTVPERYISAGIMEEAIPHKEILYGEDFVGHAVLVHEGPLDAWAVGPGAVATCGTGYTMAQILLLAKYKTRVICFDSEPEAQARANTICDLLEPFTGETINVELEANDASTAMKEGSDEIKYLRKQFLD